MTKVYDTAYFIERARKVHGNKYDYSDAVYTTAKSKLAIICPKHGRFEQQPSNHLWGKGCKKCSVLRVKDRNGNNTEGFIARAKEVHGDRYDYSEVLYKSSRKKVIITCKIHGEFQQSPEQHLSTTGCQRCANSKIASKGKKTTAQFIKEAEVVHGNTYDYSLVEVDGVFNKVDIICHEHGAFKQIPDSHLRGRGCPICGNRKIAESQIVPFSEFVRRSRLRHGDIYTYFEEHYVSAKSYTFIECRKHGVFKQAATKHMYGDGCPECGKEGLGHHLSTFRISCNKNNDGNGCLYVLRCSKGDEAFYKVGITSRSIRVRFRRAKSMPYDYKVVAEITERSDFIFAIEKRMHSLLAEFKHNPSVHFEGHTECFTIIKPVEPLLKELSTTEQLQLLA